MSAVTVSPAMRRWRIALVAGGLLLLAVGGLVLLLDVSPKNYLGIAVWFVGALVLHDGIAAMAVFGVQIVMRKIGRGRIPLGVLAILQAALVVGAIVTGIVVPEVLKKQIGSANPTILPLDYLGNLVVFYIGLALATAVAIAIYAVARRQKVRPETSHD